MITRAALAAALLTGAAPAAAGIDLSQAQISHLDNGLTVIVLEDRSLPVVSVQALYKVGSRDEEPGKTGLAHFLEHLSFRATENYPNGAAEDAVYDAGGEWHGYTWLDQTTYYATAPKGDLGLLLSIEADRMAHVTIDAASMQAEAGAVLTEMHGYENDPGSVLLDALAATAIQAHPYRIPTIGYEADVKAATAADAQHFYRAHYTPDNAVLAIVGDVDPAQALAAVKADFGAIPRGPGFTRSEAVEPGQNGERRLRLSGPARRSFLKIAFPAPAASSSDWPAFLLLQQLLSGGSGVNFDQNDWGTPVEPGSPLAGVAGDLTTWFIPTADPYLFVIAASQEPGADEGALEGAVEAKLAAARATAPDVERLAEARQAVRRELAFDVETTEDAAHQLAFFEGIGALDALFGLDAKLDAVTPADIERVARSYLAPRQRTIGWYVPGEKAIAPRAGEGAPHFAGDRPAGASSQETASAPQLRRLSGGLPAIVRRAPLSPTATVELVLSAPDAAEGESIVRSGLAADLPRLIAEARAALAAAKPAEGAAPSEDPYTRLEQRFAALMDLAGKPPRPVVATLSGDVSPDAAFAALEEAFGKVAPAAQAEPESRSAGTPSTVTERIDLPLSQAALGYIVPAPPPGSREGLAWRALLYVLSHEYGGRLGDEAIRDRGLTYYIDSDYRLAGGQGWITLGSGVDPAQMAPMETALREQLARLASDPPGEAELDRARRHLLGRDLSAAQSNREIAGRLARSFRETGELPDHEALAAALASLTPADLASAAARFAGGTIIRIEVATPDSQGPHP